MTEFLQGTALRSTGEEHLSIRLADIPTPLSNTTKKINAELNEDLLGNNKFSKGKKEFLSVNTFRRLLNEAFDNKWSWEIMNYQFMPNNEDPEYAFVVGRLYLPGLGFRDGIGTATLEKKENSAAFSIAGSNAFKNALKQSGFGASLLDEDWDEELFDEDFDEDDDNEDIKVEKPKPKPAAKPKQEAKPKAEETKPEKEEGPTKEQKEAMAELKEIYNIENNKQLLAFMQIWDPDLKALKDVSPDQLDEFLMYYDENEEKFDDFDPEEID